MPAWADCNRKVLAFPSHRGEGKSLPDAFGSRTVAPSPPPAISRFYHPIQQSWDTLNCLVWMIVFLLFILNKINYFALSCLLVAFLSYRGLKEVQVPLCPAVGWCTLSLSSVESRSCG